jgi:DNA-binding CsgD family transcriptional regulator
MKIRYSKVKQQKLEDEIEFKNKELTSNVMSLMKKNEMLGEVTNKLIEVEKQAVKEETKTALQRIAKDIEKSTQEKIWEEFEIRFKQVHSEFYERLNRNYPDLSPNEQRLCAFLRLNLSSKEIAALTNKNTRSVEMARFRLRKKLGISSQDINLISFISSI